MGFNEYIVPGRGPQQASNENPDRKKTLEKQAINDMLQCLAQLVDVRTYATEIFTNLQVKAEETSTRMRNVRKRVEELSVQVDPVDDQFHKMSPQCFYSAYANKRFQSETTPDGGLFIRRNAPAPVNRRRHQAKPTPELNKLDRYEKCLDVGARENIHCLDTYTYPRFFFDQWVQGQMELLKRKKRGKKKKKKRKRRDQPKKVTAFQKTYKDDLGREIVRKQHTVEATITDRELTRGAAMSTVNKSYGSSKQDLSAYADNRTATASVYQPAAYEPGKYQAPAQVQPGVVPMQPPGSSGPPSGPGAPPPGPGSPRQQPTRPQQAYQQPAQPAYNAAPQQSFPPSQPAQPAAPQMPEELLKYAKMMKLRVPIPAIKNKMRTDKIDTALFDQWLDPSGPKGAGVGSGPPAAPMGGPPPGPRGGPPTGPGGPPPGMGRPPRAPAGPTGGTGGLMDAIRQGASLQKAPAQQQSAPPSGGAGGMMAAIRGGGKLKNAKDRKLAERPKETNKRENMLNALRSGLDLKKASNRKLKEKEPEKENTSNIFALMKMRELIQDSDDEEGSSDGSWES